MPKKFVLLDGVANYNTTSHLYKRWDSYANATVNSSSPRRTGTRYITIGNTPTSYIAKYLPECSLSTPYENRATVGAAIKINGGHNLACKIFTFCTTSETDPSEASVAQLSMVIQGQELLVYGPDGGEGSYLDRTKFPVIRYNQWHYIEAQVQIHRTSGMYKITVDGEIVVSNSSTMTMWYQPSPNLTYIKLGSGSGITTDYTDIYMVIGESTAFGPSVIDIIRPINQGYHGTYSFTPVGSTYNYQCIDDTFLGDNNDYIKGNYDYNADESFVFTPIITYGVEDVKLVGMTIAGSTDGPGRRKLKMRVDDYPSTQYSSDYVTFSGTEYVYKQLFCEADPFTTFAWDVDNLNSYKFGIRDF